VVLSVIPHRAPPQVADRGTLSRYRGYWGNKIPRANQQTDDALPRGNQDLGRSGNCKWEAELAKLTTGEDEVIGRAIDEKRTGEDGSHRVGCRTAMWKERRIPHIMISKQQPI